MSRNDNLQVEMKFYDRTPIVERCSRFKVSVGKMQVEIIALPGNEGLYIRLDEPLGDVLSVIPHASNAVKLVPKR